MKKSCAHIFDHKENTKITIDNLTLSVSIVKTNMWVISAIYFKGFDSRSDLSLDVCMGYGVKKSHPISNSISPYFFLITTDVPLQIQDIIQTFDVKDDMILTRNNLKELFARKSDSLDQSQK